jgi:hypothetical protein
VNCCLRLALLVELSLVWRPDSLMFGVVRPWREMSSYQLFTYSMIKRGHGVNTWHTGLALDLLFRVMIDWHHPLIRWHHSPDTLTPASQIRKESCKKLCYLTCSLYSQRANHMISKKVAEFIKLIERFRILQGWLKTSDIWRDYQVWNESFLKLFQKFKVLMFLGERTLKK